MSKTLLIVNDFGIGGIQRLALDQSYYLSSKGVNSTILILGHMPGKDLPSFFNSEQTLIKKLGINFISFNGSRISQLRELVKLFKHNDFNLVICNNSRSTVLSFVGRIISRKKLVIVSIIHQLLSMSSPLQRTKRIIYSQFSDILFAYSVAVEKDWNFRRKHNFFIWMLSCFRKISVCRNGVFLPRINSIKFDTITSEKKGRRLIFASRITSWKGLEHIKKVLTLPRFANTELLLITPFAAESFINEVSVVSQNLVTNIVGKSITEIDFNSNDLHLYPTSYGGRSKFIEGISLNVLEMSCIGVKSFITKFGAETWPELADMGVVQEVDWDELSDTDAELILSSTVLGTEKIEKSQALIDIANNIRIIFEEAGLNLPS
jgi:hypothetical protein